MILKAGFLRYRPLSEGFSRHPDTSRKRPRYLQCGMNIGGRWGCVKEERVAATVVEYDKVLGSLSASIWIGQNAVVFLLVLHQGPVDMADRIPRQSRGDQPPFTLTM